MSNYSTFFPSAAAGGSTEITDPDKISLSFFGTQYGYGLNPNYMWWTARNDQTSIAYSSYSFDPLIGSASYGGSAQYRASASVSANVEETLLNITDGSGYLCNVSTAVGKASFQGVSSCNQKIVIIVDGTTYTYEYDTIPSYGGYNNRLFWGYFGNGFWDNREFDANNYQYFPTLRSSNLAGSVFGVGGQPTNSNSTLPPLYGESLDDQWQFSNRRIFSANDFKLYNLPKLRFETSLVVKVTTEQPDSTTDYRSYAGASYYLDTQVL